MYKACINLYLSSILCCNSRNKHIIIIIIIIIILLILVPLALLIRSFPQILPTVH